MKYASQGLFISVLGILTLDHNSLNPKHDARTRKNYNIFQFVRFEVFTVVTMKNGVFWDVTTCGSYKSCMA
jgi:hypothetical protein